MPRPQEPCTVKILEEYSPLRAFLYSRFHKNPLVRTVGDSHVMAFKKDINFFIDDIGPATAFNLKNKESTTRSNEKLFKIIKKIDKRNDIVMLSFGEIDCRNHIYNEYKKSKEKISISKLINQTIANYGEVLQKLKEEEIRFCVLGVPPAGHQENIYGFTYYAPVETRVLINREFNEKLANFCREKGFKFINLYQKVVDERGFILKEFAADKIHLNEKVVPFVRHEIIRLFD